MGSPSPVCFLLVTHPTLAFLCLFFDLSLINADKKLLSFGQSPTQQIPVGLCGGVMGRQGSALTRAIGWRALVCLSFPGHISCVLGRGWNRVGELPVRFPRRNGGRAKLGLFCQELMAALARRSQDFTDL